MGDYRNNIGVHVISEERLRILIQHFRDELHKEHTLYTEHYRKCELDAAAALGELIELRNALAQVPSRCGNCGADLSNHPTCMSAHKCNT